MGSSWSNRGITSTLQILLSRHFQQGGRLRVPWPKFLLDRRHWQLGREPKASGRRHLRVQFSPFEDVRASTRKQALERELGGLPINFLGLRHKKLVPNQTSRAIRIFLRSRLQHPLRRTQI